MWIPLTEADALTVVNAKLLDASRTKALAAGQADPLIDTLQQVIDQVRGAVGACKANTLGAAGTIPQKLKGTALDLFAVRITNRLDIDPSESKLLLYKTAEATLRAVAACSFDIEEPVETTEEISASPTPRITPRCRQFTRRDGDGS